MEKLIAAIICFAIAGIIMILVARYKAKLISEGKMLQRSNDFTEYAEIFTLRPVTDEMVANALAQYDFKKTVGCSLTGDTRSMQFTHLMKKYRAILVCTQMNELGTVYSFEFTNWMESHGRPTEGIGMNMLLTSVERMFLSLDSNTQVSTRKLDFKTERKWI